MTFAAAGLLASGCRTAPKDPYDGPRPIAVLIEEDPDLMVIGSDMPRVALYENGLLIYVDGTRASGVYKTKMLGASDLRDLRARLGPTPAFLGLEKSYSPGDSTDQAAIDIFLSADSAARAVSVKGLAAGPEEFRRVYDVLRNIRRPDSVNWIPDGLEVMFWPFDGSTLPPVPWPEEWPSLGDRFTRKRGVDTYSVYMAGEGLEDLKAYRAGLADGQAVLIDGRKWAMEFRYVFPQEPVWRQAIGMDGER